MREFLDEEGGKYIVQRVKNMISEIPVEGIADIDLVDYELIFTLADGTIKNLGSVRGEKGADGTMTFADLTEEQKESLKGEKGDSGEMGTAGEDGFSPTISVTEVSDGYELIVTDKNGTQTINIKNGKDGENGSDGTAAEVDLSDYYNKEEVDAKIPDVSQFLSQIPDEYITEDELNNKGYLKEHQSLENYATNEYVLSEIAKAQLEGSEVDLSAYALKSEIPNVSDFLTSIPDEYITEAELDEKGYLTEHQDLSEYALKSELGDSVVFVGDDIPDEDSYKVWIKPSADTVTVEGSGFQFPNFQEQEIKTGYKWVDGKDIYVKTFHWDAAASYSSSDVVRGIYNNTYDFSGKNIIGRRTMWYNSAGNFWGEGDFAYATTPGFDTNSFSYPVTLNATYVLTAEMYTPSTGGLYPLIRRGKNVFNWTATMIIYFTM